MQNMADTVGDTVLASQWPANSVILDHDGEPQVFWRGEKSGEAFATFDVRKTDAGVGFFFATAKEHADSYAGAGSLARAFHLKANNLLDLRDPYTRANIAFIREYAAEFDDWIDRESGEPMDAATFIDAGSLYAYEGTGSGTRWNRLFSFAQEQGFDAVLVGDVTDGVREPVIVVFDNEQVVFVDAPEPHKGRRSGP
jgi:hypothetical protein